MRLCVPQENSVPTRPSEGKDCGPVTAGNDACPGWI